MSKTGFCSRSYCRKNIDCIPLWDIICWQGTLIATQDGYFPTIWHINAVKAAGIRSKARKCKYKPPGEESIKYENHVKGHWNAKAPLQIVVSDMTVLKDKGKQWEWTLLVDTFNNEIIAHSVSPIAGDTKPYYHCRDILTQLAGKKEEQKPQVVFHTDQGAVYSSKAFHHAHEHYNILRSMSRGGTPTDNPIIEALNGWMKEELYLDFGLAEAENLPNLLNKYILGLFEYV